MKRFLSALALFLLLSSTRYAGAETTAQNLSKARTHYAKIERNLKSYKRIETDLPDQSTEGGSFSVYHQNNVPQKIVAHLYKCSGQTISEYYFWNGALFFVLKTELRYNEPIGATYDDKTELKVVKRTQNRFYFSSSKVIRWADNKGKIRTQNLQNQQTENLNEARRYWAKANALLD